MEPTTITGNDLPLWDGRPYHILTKREDLAPFVVLCGEQNRAHEVAKMFLHEIREIGNPKRGIVGYIGKTAAGVVVAVWGTGMGLSTTCIVMYEMLSFAALDTTGGSPVLRAPSDISSMTFIRLGTTGAWGTPPIGTAMITDCGIHQGALPLYSVQQLGSDEANLNLEFLVREQLRREKLAALDKLGIRQEDVPPTEFEFPIHAYRASPDVVVALDEAARELEVPSVLGHTMSCDGFFEAQGRGWGPFESATPGMIEALNRRAGVENAEMEAAEILRRVSLWNQWARERGLPQHRAGAVCAAIANRGGDTFSGESEKREAVNNSARLVVSAIDRLAR